MREYAQNFHGEPIGRLRKISPGNIVEIYTQGSVKDRKEFKARVIDIRKNSTQPNNPTVVVEKMETEESRKELHLGGGTWARVIDPSEPTPMQKARQGIEEHMKDASGLRFQAFIECITRNILDIPAITPEDEARLKTLNKAIARSKKKRAGYESEFNKASAVIGVYDVAFEKSIGSGENWVTAKYHKLPADFKEIREQEWNKRGNCSPCKPDSGRGGALTAGMLLL